MFKTLIATCLLCSSLSSGSFKHIEEPRREYVPNTIISGAYTFNNVFDLDFDRSASLVFDESYNISVYIYRTTAYNVPSVSPFRVRSFSITRPYDNYVTFLLDYYVANGYDDGVYNVLFEPSLSCDLDSLIDYYEGHSDPRITSVDLLIKNFVIVFGTPTYLSGDELDIFNRFFNSNGNMYTTRYQGWYSYRNANWFNNSFHFELQNSTFIVNNGIFDSYVHQSDIVYFSGVTMATSESYQFDVFNAPSTYNRIKPIHLYGLIPYSIRSHMSVEGVFDFVDVVQPTTWYEMILSVMDAPIYYLSSLFGFEMFGISLFVALTSLFTLLVVVTIIKKVV